MNIFTGGGLLRQHGEGSITGAKMGRMRFRPTAHSWASRATNGLDRFPCCSWDCFKPAFELIQELNYGGMDATMSSNADIRN